MYINIPNIATETRGLSLSDPGCQDVEAAEQVFETVLGNPQKYLQSVKCVSR